MGTVPAPNIFEESQAIAQAPQNALAEYARVAQLKAQTAQEQQQTQAAQLENQQRQQQLLDQKAMTTALQSWDGKNLDDLPTAVLKNGGSANAVFGLKQQILQQKQNLAKLSTDQLDNMSKQHDAALGVLKAAEDVPDDQLGEHLTSSAQDLIQNGLLDPQHAQTVAALAQLPPDQARARLAVIEKGLQGEKAQFAEAQEAQKTAASTQEAHAKELGAQTSAAELQAKLPGGPLANVEQAEMADYLRKNPGKGPSDFLAWKAKQNPTALVLGNQLGQAGQGDFDPKNPVDIAAKRYNDTGGELPSGFYRSPGTLAAIIKRASELPGGDTLAANKATLNADKAALQKVQSQFDLVNAFEGTALKNLDLYAQTAAKIPDLKSRFANVPLRMITGKMIGTDNMAALNAARNTAASEVAKVLSSATGSGVLSDTQKKEAQDVIDGNLPLSATLAVVNTLKSDMANRHQSYQDDVNAIRGRLGAQPQGQQSGASGGDFFSQFGGKKR